MSRNYQDFSYIPCPHIYPCFLTIHILHQSDTCVTVSESRSPHHYHQSPWFTLGFTLAVAQSMGLDKYIMTCVLQDSIVQSSFTSLNILCALPTHPSLALNFWQPWIFFIVSIVLSFLECHMELERSSVQHFQIQPSIFYISITSFVGPFSNSGFEFLDILGNHTVSITCRVSTQRERPGNTMSIVLRTFKSQKFPSHFTLC